MRPPPKRAPYRSGLAGIVHGRPDARQLRLATGCAFTTIGSGALGLTRFSRFLATRHPEAGEPGAITRPVLEDYLSWLLTEGYSAATRALSLSMIRVFLKACHRHNWLPALPPAPPSTSKNFPSTTTRSPGSSPGT